MSSSEASVPSGCQHPKLGRFVGLVPCLFVTALGLSTGCSSTSQLDSIQAQLRDLQQQSLQIQKQTSSKQEIADLQEAQAERAEGLLRAQADIQLEMQAVASLIQQLQAKLEDTNYRLAQLSQQIAATNQELQTSRIAPTLGPLPDGSAGGNLGGVVDPGAQYQTAYNDYLRGSYDLAVLGFRQYLESFPDTDLADNASYWIGECYYRQRKFREATREFDRVLDRYPNSDKVASTLLRKGYAYLELGSQDQGVVQLQSVIRRYPESDEANLARQQLTSLGITPQGR
jgi:tol-pal system protein YbgF